MLMAIVLGAVLAANPPALAGHWVGTMQRGAAVLPVTFDFPSDAAGKGFFSAPDLNAIDVPLSNVREGATVHWELTGDAFTTAFDGNVAGDAMTGTFREPPGEGTFTLHRVSSSTAKPYTTEAVTFSNGSVRLAGTVFAPRTAGKHPAMIFLHGSGAEGRWGSAYLADYVARHGIVALMYDKRGVGASTGDWRASTMQDLVGDGRAGVELLAQRADVDPANIGVYGHSQGGELAPAVAERNGHVAWIVAADSFIGPQYRQICIVSTRCLGRCTRAVSSPPRKRSTPSSSTSLAPAKRTTNCAPTSAAPKAHRGSTASASPTTRTGSGAGTRTSPTTTPRRRGAPCAFPCCCCTAQTTRSSRRRRTSTALARR